MIYIGFDLGDGESCLSYTTGDGCVPIPIPVAGETSFLTAVGRIDGKIVVGNPAVSERAEDTRVCFKRSFRDDHGDSRRAIRDFAAGVLEDIRASGIPGVSDRIDDPEKTCFVVGCPAGWNAFEREEYLSLLKSAGMRNIRLASESRAAFETFAVDHEFSVDRSLFNESVLVIDIGSSTLDFSLVRGGNEHEVEIMGNTLLGGGIMDEILLLRSIDLIPDAQKRETVRQAVESDPAAKSRLMITVRRMKEDYFSNEETYLAENREFTKQAILVAGGSILRFNLRISPEIVMNFVQEYPHPLLHHQTFVDRLKTSLTVAHNNVKKGGEPKLVILTGGASRMHFFQDMCRETFKKSQVIISGHPESDISYGLACLGAADDSMHLFLNDVKSYVSGPAVETIVQEHLPELIDAVCGPMSDALFESCVMPNVEKWKADQIDTLNELKDAVSSEMPAVMRSAQMQRRLAGETSEWTLTVMNLIQQDMNRMALKHRIRTNPIRLTKVNVASSGSAIASPVISDPLGPVADVIGVIVTIVLGTICGGSGMALIASGPVGSAVGVVIGLLGWVVGKEAAGRRMMDVKLPSFMRGLIRLNRIDSPEQRAVVARSIKASLMNDPAFSAGLVSQISTEIDSNLEGLAESAERQM